MTADTITTTSEQEQMQANIDSLKSALAYCRDIFTVPEVGTNEEKLWMSAIGDPESVPCFVDASVKALLSEIDKLRNWYSKSKENYAALESKAVLMRDALIAERDAMQAKLDALQKQEPMGVVDSGEPDGIGWAANGQGLVDGQELYAAPVVAERKLLTDE